MDFTGYQSQADSNHHSCKMDTDVLSVIHFNYWSGSVVSLLITPFNKIYCCINFVYCCPYCQEAIHSMVQTHRLLVVYMLLSDLSDQCVPL